VLGVVAGLEYPWLWHVLRREPVTWVATTFFYGPRGDDSAGAGAGAGGGSSDSGDHPWGLGGTSGAVYAPVLCAWWLAVVAALLAWAPSHGSGGSAATATAAATTASGGSDAGMPAWKRALSPATSAQLRLPPTPTADAAAGARGVLAHHATAVLRRARLLSAARANLLLRKLFHVASVAMFAPPLLLGRGHTLFACLALAAAVKGGVLLELARALRAPPAALTARVHAYVTRFTDARDSGVFIVTHLLLLAGCALPVWLSALPRPPRGSSGAGGGGDGGGDGGGGRDGFTPHLAGVLALGVGDAAAAAVGVTAVSLGLGHTWGGLCAAARRHGSSCWRGVWCGGAGGGGGGHGGGGGGGGSGGARDRPATPATTTPASWPGARKTVEGTLAYAVSCVCTLAALQRAAAWAAPLRGAPPAAATSPAVLAAFAASALVETFNPTLDNLTLPLFTWLALRAAEGAPGGPRI
jgi:dolichol kinase